MSGKYKGSRYEFDSIAHNGDEIVIVEVKTTMRVRHVKHFIEKLQEAKNMMPEYKHHTVYGAMAFLRAEEMSDIFAENEKLFVIRATGDSASVINAEGFVPRTF